MYYAIFDGKDYLSTGYNETDLLALRNDLADLMQDGSDESIDELQYYEMQPYDLAAHFNLKIHESEIKFLEAENY